MKKFLTNILSLFFFCILFANRIPDNGGSFNYTQLFFKWDQIPHAINYELSIQNLNTDEWFYATTTSNSHLLTNNFIDWNSNFEWFICGHFEDNSEPICNEIYEFSIEPLPDYFPNQI